MTLLCTSFVLIPSETFYDSDIHHIYKWSSFHLKIVQNLLWSLRFDSKKQNVGGGGGGNPYRTSEMEPVTSGGALNQLPHKEKPSYQVNEVTG